MGLARQARAEGRRVTTLPTLAALPPEARDAQIMTICDRAIADLREARDIEEVRRISAFADAMAAYAPKLKAALAAQNHAQLVVLLAEARIGAELKAAQTRGELAAKAGRPKNVGVADDFSKATHADFGFPRWRASEMKRLAELGEDTIRQVVTEATEAQVRATKAAILRDIEPHAEANRGTPPRYTVDLEGADPADYQVAIQCWGVLRELKVHCEKYPPDAAARGMPHKLAAQVAQFLVAFDEWRTAFEAGLKEKRSCFSF